MKANRFTVLRKNVGSGNTGSGRSRGEVGKGRLDDKESGANKNAHKNEKKALFFEEIIERSAKGSRMFQGFGRVRWVLRHGDFFISSCTGLLMQLLHGWIM